MLSITSNVNQIIEGLPDGLLGARPDFRKAVHGLILSNKSTVSKFYSATRTILSSFDAPLSLEDQLIAAQLMCISCLCGRHAEGQSHSHEHPPCSTARVIPLYSFLFAGTYRETIQHLTAQLQSHSAAGAECAVKFSIEEECDINTYIRVFVALSAHSSPFWGNNFLLE